MRELRIACSGSGVRSLDELVPLQGDLKMMTTTDAEKLERALATKGFRFPVFVWRDDARGIERIIDGHQRRNVLLKMRKDGWRIPPLPVNMIEAENEIEARQLVLAAISQYGRIDIDELANFLPTAELDLDQLIVDFRLPDVDEDMLKALAAGENPKEQDDDDNVGTPSEGLQFSVIVDFDNEHAQGELLEELETRGMKCRLLIS